MRYLVLHPPFIPYTDTDTIVPMALKMTAEARKANFAKERETASATSMQFNQSNTLVASQENLASAKAQVASLEATVPFHSISQSRVTQTFEFTKSNACHTVTGRMTKWFQRSEFSPYR